MWKERLLKIFVFALFLVLGKNVLASNWVVCYAEGCDTAQLLTYDVTVLDSHSHPPLKPLIERQKEIYGYLSVGEVESYRPWFTQMQEAGLLLAENPNWPGSFYIDLRDRRWHQRVVEVIIPGLIHQGFNGIFLDTLDNPLELERVDPKGMRGMTQAAVELIQAIRYHYPYLNIMVNRAYSLLPKIAPSINAVLGESLYAGYDFEKKRPQRVADAEYRLQRQWLQDLKKMKPEIKIYSLDYWNFDDVTEVKNIYRIQRQNGFIPYVAEIALDRVMPEPVE